MTGKRKPQINQPDIVSVVKKAKFKHEKHPVTLYLRKDLYQKFVKAEGRGSLSKVVDAFIEAWLNSGPPKT